jgi:hypothetical protein
MSREGGACHSVKEGDVRSVQRTHVQSAEGGQVCLGGMRGTQ